MENSVLIWTENSQLMKLTEKVVSYLNIQLKEADCATDLIAIPCFFLIIDASLINEEAKELLHEMSKIMHENEQNILIFGEVKLPKRLWKFVNEFDILPSQDELEKLIIKARESNPVYQRKIMNEKYDYKKFDHTKKRIFRVWYIYNELKKNNGYVNAYDYATIFDVSDKTIHRDIATLREFGCVIEPDRREKQGSGFYLLNY